MKPVDAIAILWRFPLALLSFAFFRYARFWMRWGYARFMRQHPELAPTWRVLSGDAIARPLALPIVLTSGPRWNVHAIIAAAGPFEVRDSIEIDRAAASRSAGAWTVVAYRGSAIRTVASVGSRDPGSAGGSLRLPPGTYSLGLRYYRWGDSPALPAVRVDGRDVVPALEVPAAVNRFYETLLGRRRAIHVALHYYVWVLLLHRRLFPRRLVEREYLPAGNPETRFEYGAFRAGESVRIDLEPAVLESHDVYLCVYDRASFPIHWEDVPAARHETRPFPTPGTWLLRIHPRSAR